MVIMHTRALTLKSSSKLTLKSLLLLVNRLVLLAIINIKIFRIILAALRRHKRLLRLNKLKLRKLQLYLNHTALQLENLINKNKETNHLPSFSEPMKMTD